MDRFIPIPVLVQPKKKKKNRSGSGFSPKRPKNRIGPDLGALVVVMVLVVKMLHSVINISIVKEREKKHNWSSRHCVLSPVLRCRWLVIERKERKLGAWDAYVSQAPSLVQVVMVVVVLSGK